MSIILESLTKRYDGYPVVNNVSLEVADGEFFVLLGSSGSGKTTILSLIAGLTTAETGRVLLHGRDVTYLPTQQRRVGFVFQNYALFQYMTVGENVEFGLSVRKVPAVERRRRRDELLELVGLAGLGKRMPRQISGGQQQRVALARALAVQPEVLLLDEPLGALDAKIRVELRRTLKAIQRQLGIATILVTHDQEEAFDLADRIGVMSFGRLLEVGTPEDLYQRPHNEFVATFLGTANLLVGQADGDCVRVGKVCLPLSANSSQPEALAVDPRVQVLFRPEDVAVASEPGGLNCTSLGTALVEEITFGGSFERLRLRLPPMPGVRPISPPVAFGSDSILLESVRSPDQADRFPLQPGDSAWVGVRRVHALAHPGLRFLIVSDGSLRSQAALTLGGHLARLSHARVTLLGCGQEAASLETGLQEARKLLGSGLAALDVQPVPGGCAEAVRRTVERQPCDLVILGFSPQEDVDLAEEILRAGNHHLLIVPCAQPVPAQALVCVASGEPGKDDVLFAGRLMRHLGASAALLTVLAAGEGEEPRTWSRAERFLENGVQTFGLLDVPAQKLIRTGAVNDVITNELKTGGYDLLVMGAPLAHASGDISLSGVVGQVLSTVTDRAVLVIRSHFMGDKTYKFNLNGKTPAFREIVR